MNLGIYKKGQGYWTRLMSAIALGTLVAMGGFWLAENLRGIRIFGLEPVYSQATVFLLVAAVFGAIGYYLIGMKPKVVDFLVATEGEMKKVNWSTPQEIAGSTYLVLSVTIIIGIFCFVYDLIFQYLSIQAGILEYID